MLLMKIRTHKYIQGHPVHKTLITTFNFLYLIRTEGLILGCTVLKKRFHTVVSEVLSSAWVILYIYCAEAVPSINYII